MAIPDSIRERIIQEFKYVGQQLTVANGFNSDCGSDVKRGRVKWEENDAPCMSIFPQPETASRTAYGKDSMVMPMKFDVLETYESLVSEHGEEAASVMGEKVIADIREVIRRSYTILLDGLVQDIQYTGGGIQDYPELSKKTVGVTATFDVTYVTKLGDPYNQ